MRKRIFCLLIALLLAALAGCAKYRRADFLGKTSAQIEAQYGQFDIRGSFVSTDNKHRDYGCGYLIKESQVGFLGTTPAEYFFIVFNENGIATACYNGYHCNGG